MKIGIYYDTLLGVGGAEKVVVQMANELNAEIVTSGYDPGRLIIKPRNIVHNLGNITAEWQKSIGYVFEAPLRFYWNRNKFHFDIEIFIGYTSIYAVKKRSKSIWYCLTPNRILYDLRQNKLANQGLAGKLALRAHILLFSQWDKRCVARFSTIISQTKNVQSRVQKTYGRQSKVIYAPVDTKKYTLGKAGDYFLAVSRLAPEKRMILIAESFVGRQEQLILVGTGPERLRIQAIAAKNKNIHIKANIPEAELRKLFRECLATIYMPIDEDYGLVPIEGMAAGKPCIAVNEGGCRETVVDGRTGFLVSPDIRSVQDAVGKVTPEWAEEHSADCRNQAMKFDITPCIAAWTELIAQEATL